MNYTQTKDLCVSTFHRLLQRERLTAFLFKVRNWSLNPDILYIILTSSPFCLFFMSLTSHKLKTCVFYVPSYKLVDRLIAPMIIFTSKSVLTNLW